MGGGIVVASTGNVGEPLNAVGQIVELRLYSKLGAQVAVNTRHFRVLAVGGVGVDLSVAGAYYDGVLAPLYKALLSAEATYAGLSVSKIFPLPRKAPAFNVDGAGVGSAAGAALPKQTSGLIRFQSPLAGRAGQGHLYMPFASEGVNDTGGVPSVAYKSGLTDLADALTGVDELGGAGNTVQLQSILWRADVNTYVDFLNWFVSPFWATQRKRGDFGRPNTSPV